MRLGDEHIDTHIELFQLGLDSLSFLDLSAEIKKQFAVNIDAEQSYDDMTIAGLASVIRTAAPEKFTVTEAPIIKTIFPTQWSQNDMSHFH